MALELSILYRGPLSSCNYDCHYCPFAKHHETAAELKRDRLALDRFVSWLDDRPNDRLSVFFTPWGEALVRRWYRDAITHLTHLPQIEKIAIQTNLSCPLDWLGQCDLTKLGLWCTYHPSQVEHEVFLGQCQALDRHGARYSVGAVGLREDAAAIERLRAALDPSVYLWVNAYKRQPGEVDEQETRRWEAIDPLYRMNTRYHATLGRACRCGSQVIAVDGEGVIRRCHFIPQALGNLYEPGFEALLVERPCTNTTCGCHIGYVHLDELQQYPVYGDGVLERIPLPQALALARSRQPAAQAAERSNV